MILNTLDDKNNELSYLIISMYSFPRSVKTFITLSVSVDNIPTIHIAITHIVVFFSSRYLLIFLSLYSKNTET